MATGQKSKSQITYRSERAQLTTSEGNATSKPPTKRAVRSTEVQRQKRSADSSGFDGSMLDYSRGTKSDISDDDADQPQVIKKSRRSLVHDYAEKVSEWEYRCHVCKKTIRCSKGSNANIRRHLGNTHALSHLKSDSHSSSSKQSFDPMRKKKNDEAAVNCILRDGRPFGDFRRPGMTSFLNTVTPGYRGPHERTVQRAVKRLYISKMAELKEKLQQINYVAMTTDLWKRPNKHYYLCATVHFLDEDYKSVSTVLSFRRFHGRHLGMRIRNHLLRIIKLFDLQSKIVATLTDNGSDVKAATQLKKTFGVRLHCLAHGLNLTLQNGLGLWQKPKQKVHVVSSPLSNQAASLSVMPKTHRQSDEDSEYEDDSAESASNADKNSKNGDAENSESGSDDETADALPRDDDEVISSDEETETPSSPQSGHVSSFDVEHVCEILQRCRTLVNTINKSNALHEALQNLVTTDPQPGLVVDMRVRWGSTHKMIQRILLHRDQLNQLIISISSLPGITTRQRQVLIDSCLSDDEWHILSVLCNCLGLFADASDMLSGSSYPSFGLVYPVLDSLNFYLTSPTEDEVESLIKSALLPAFRRYMIYDDDSTEKNLLLITSFINPMIHEVMNDDDNKMAKNLIIREWNSMNKKGVVELDTTNSSATSLSTSILSINKGKDSGNPVMERLMNFRKKCGIMDQETDHRATTETTLTIKQELAQFEAYDKSGHSFSSFWQKHSGSLPILRQIVKRFGCIPATSVPSESAFSVAGYVARKTRASLSAKTMKYTMFLKDKC